VINYKTSDEEPSGLQLHEDWGDSEGGAWSGLHLLIEEWWVENIDIVVVKSWAKTKVQRRNMWRNPPLSAIPPPPTIRGRILEQNSDKSFKSFPPCNSESPLQLCLDISISQTHATSYSLYSALLYTLKEKGGKPDRKPHPLAYGLRNLYRNLKFENSQDNPETSKKLYVHEYGFRNQDAYILQLRSILRLNL
jgi:hypothetical protein